MSTPQETQSISSPFPVIMAGLANVAGSNDLAEIHCGECDQKDPATAALQLQIKELQTENESLKSELTQQKESSHARIQSLEKELRDQGRELKRMTERYECMSILLDAQAEANNDDDNFDLVHDYEPSVRSKTDDLDLDSEDGPRVRSKTNEPSIKQKPNELRVGPKPNESRVRPKTDDLDLDSEDGPRVRSKTNEPSVRQMPNELSVEQKPDESSVGQKPNKLRVRQRTNESFIIQRTNANNDSHTRSVVSKRLQNQAIEMTKERAKKKVEKKPSENFCDQSSSDDYWIYFDTMCSIAEHIRENRTCAFCDRYLSQQKSFIVGAFESVNDNGIEEDLLSCNYADLVTVTNVDGYCDPHQKEIRRFAPKHYKRYLSQNSEPTVSRTRTFGASFSRVRPQDDFYQQDQPQDDFHRQDQPRVDFHRQDQPRVDSHRRSWTQVDFHQQDQPQVDFHRQDQPQVDFHRQDQPRVDSHRRSRPQVNFHQRDQPPVQQQISKPLSDLEKIRRAIEFKNKSIE